jgi:serine/threonine protein phosphatase PrpC
VAYRKPTTRLRTVGGIRACGFGLTHVGRRRPTNEDSFCVDDALGLYIVADGMGGHAAGEVASREAVDAVFGMVKSGRSGLRTLKAPLVEDDARAACRLMESAVQAATYQIFALAQHEQGKQGMGTTLSSLFVLGGYAVMAHVGDSRIYRVRDGVAELVTNDHTLVAWQLEKGLITEHEARTSPKRNVISRSVGYKDHVDVDTGLISLEPGDRFVLCSDGLHGYLKTDDVSFTVMLGGEGAAQRFIELANERGGADNITAVVVEID